MDFEQFKTEVIDEMRERFPELEIGTQEVKKLQGQSYDGMSVQPEGSNIAATINLEGFFGLSYCSPKHPSRFSLPLNFLR